MVSVQAYGYHLEKKVQTGVQVSGLYELYPKRFGNNNQQDKQNKNRSC